jgi:Fe-S cluster assembly protein SufD
VTGEYVQELFKDRVDKLPGSAQLRATREKAMAAFNKIGFPTRKHEDWRYTDLKAISDSQFDLLPNSPSQDAIAQAYERIDGLNIKQESARIIFVDGHPLAADDLPHLPDGVTISCDEASLAAINEQTISDSLHTRPLAAINTAFTTNSTRIIVADNARPQRPLHLVYASSDQANAGSQPRLDIILGDGAELKIVQHFLSATACSSWTNMVTQLTLNQGAELTIHRLQEHGRNHLHTELLTARVAQDAELRLGLIDLGGQLVRNDIQVNLAEPGASCDLFGVFMANENQHIDNHIRVDHSAPRTISNETFKGIIGERGRGVFNGKVVVHKDAQKIDATQSSDNLLLSEHGEIDTKPELEIYADDVKCSHGATVGQLDEDQLFYLRSRGIDEKTARALMTFAFANEILQRLKSPASQQRMAQAIMTNLPGRQQWDELL